MEDKVFSQNYQKLARIMDYFQLNGAEFASKIGVPPSTIYDIKRGQIKNLSSEISEKILRTFPEINSMWLLTGEGSMLATGTINASNSAVAVNHSTATNHANSPDLDKLIDAISVLTETNRQQSEQIGQLIKMLSNK